MSTTAQRMPLGHARSIAETLCGVLQGGCSRIEIAGSVRRRRPSVGDVELVAIPLPKLDLFGQPFGQPFGTELDAILAELERAGSLRRLKGGERYMQFAITAHAYNRLSCDSTIRKLDLFIVAPETWGILFLLRTGSADFSRRFVTHRSRGGLLPDDLRVADGRLWRGHRLWNGQEPPLETPEEADAFRLAGLPWIDPWERE